MINWRRDRLIGRHADLRKSVSFRRQTSRKRRLAKSQHRLRIVVPRGDFAERRQRRDIGAGLGKVANERQDEVEFTDRIENVRGMHDIAPCAARRLWRRQDRNLTVTKSSAGELTVISRGIGRGGLILRTHFIQTGCRPQPFGHANRRRAPTRLDRSNHRQRDEVLKTLSPGRSETATQSSRP